MLAALASGCSSKETATDSDTAAASSETASSVAETKDEASSVPASDGIDYMVLVNKLNPLPEDWEDKLECVTVKNSVGNDVEVEKKAYDAYEKLKADLESEDIFVDLDSARRSVEEQQRIMDEFTRDHGADYAAKTVATPGYSEHHTGLALDLYLIVDGNDVTENDDMIQYTDIWAKIHEKLPRYGFILRYLDGKEHITGYGYEPWHIRYIDNADTANEITSKGVTFEEYLGAVKSSDVKIDLGSSEIFSEDELKEAVIQIKCKFASFRDCELHSITYAGDETCSDENIARMNDLDEGAEYTQAIKFTSEFHAYNSPVFDPDSEQKDYEWWLARGGEDGWQLVTWGY